MLEDFPEETRNRLTAKAEEMLAVKLFNLNLKKDEALPRVTVVDFDEFANYWEWILDKETPEEKYLFSMYLDIIEEGESFFAQQHLFDIQITVENREAVLSGFNTGKENRLSGLQHKRNTFIDYSDDEY